MSVPGNDGAAVGPDPREAIDGDESDFDEDMSAAERDLAEDAQWKRIQQNTFTRWANEHLKTVNRHILNLETDLADGLNLITLIEVLSGKKLPKHNKKPNFRSQKLENVSVALKFLEQDEGIRIVNIGECKQSGTKWILPPDFSLVPAALNSGKRAWKLERFLVDSGDVQRKHAVHSENAWRTSVDIPDIVSCQFK